MKVAWAVIALFAVRFAVAAWFYPTQDADLAWQNVLGTAVLQTHHIPDRLGNDTFTAAGAAWVPQEWVFSTAVAAAMQAHRFGWLAVFSTACAVLALVLTGLRARMRGASAIPIAFVTFCTGLALMQSYGVRAQVIAWPLLAALFLVLDSEGPLAYLAIPIVAVWANVHASAVAAPVLVAVWTIGTAIEDRGWTPRLERNVVLTLGTVLAVFCTPLFWKLPLYAIQLFNSPFKNTISEWQPSNLSYYSFTLGLLPLLLGAAWLGIAAPRERWRDGMVYGVTAALAFLAVRNISVCALVIAPMVAQRLSALIPDQRRINTIFSEPLAQGVLATATIVSALAIGSALAKSPQISGEALPKAAVASLASDGERRVYCEDFAWCSLALEHRQLKTFVDGRCDPFPLHVWNEYVAVQRLQPSWRSILARYDVDSIVAAQGNPLAQALALDRSWHRGYSDRQFVVFLRDEKRTAQR